MGRKRYQWTQKTPQEIGAKLLTKPLQHFLKRPIEKPCFSPDCNKAFVIGDAYRRSTKAPSAIFGHDACCKREAQKGTAQRNGEIQAANALNALPKAAQDEIKAVNGGMKEILEAKQREQLIEVMRQNADLREENARLRAHNEGFREAVAMLSGLGVIRNG